MGKSESILYIVELSCWLYLNLNNWYSTPVNFEHYVSGFQDLFKNPDTIFHLKELYIAKDEASITEVLNRVDTEFKNKVILGSYPDFYNR